ncbi:MAG: Y-family DNA polymerase [Solobacterium sp.]|nr:Y-family DNA polymerase [Solobacterium sp.]
MSERTYIAIDLKSFYASVECRERNLDPLTTNLVVADESRTNKTICLAVSPSLKSFGIPGRPRLFEVEQRVRALNKERDPWHRSASSRDYAALRKDPSLRIDYHVAVPRMALYIDYSTRIYNIYLRYIAPEDIHVYSIDEVFMDVTGYLRTYGKTPHELAVTMIRDVLKETGITATAGIGTNLYLAKVAMDITAKHMPADQDGVRIAELNEYTYRKQLWTHEPLTDFWRVGRGYAKRLNAMGIYTMGDVARTSLTQSEALYSEFGVNAELLIDHAWGYEPCMIRDIKAYKPEHNSIGSGQVLMEPYTYEKAMIVLREMTDALVLELVDKGLMTNALALFVGYDASVPSSWNGTITTNRWGLRAPKPANSIARLKHYTSSSKEIMDAMLKLYARITDKSLKIRRFNVTAVNVLPREEASSIVSYEQLDLFASPEAQKQPDPVEAEKEQKVQQAILDIQKKYGKNAVLKGTSLQDGATAKERNKMIGGHRK